MEPPVGPPVYTRSQRRQALAFAVVGNLIPLVLATADDFGSHRTSFFVGAAVAMLAPIVVVLAPPRLGMIRTAFAFAGIPALTALQAYSGGVGSRYAVLMVMATIWFGVQARRTELVGGIVIIALCCFAPMLVFGAPAYPVQWLQATLVLFISCAVIGSLATISRETWRLNAALRAQATRDELTGLLNRRGWLEAAERELARARRGGLSVALVAIDLDALKLTNDTMGHDEGDRLIRETAQRIGAAFRAEDVAARLGGDEYSVLLLDITGDDVFGTLERLRGSTPDKGPFSAGVAIGKADETLAEMQRRADLALYEAKRGGRQRSVLADGPVRSL